jgi:hypothetical protein
VITQNTVYWKKAGLFLALLTDITINNTTKGESRVKYKNGYEW